MKEDRRKITYLKNNDELKSFCQAQGTPDSIGFDTEFLRVKTYFPKACLFQIATRDALALIDVLSIDDLKPLDNWLANPDIKIIMHAAGQDLELLQYLFGTLPRNIFDTQIANAFLAEDGQLGYAGLVEQELHVTLEKSQSRTDWSRRPLSEKQLEYAIDDVRYLHSLMEKLTIQLEQNNVYGWFEQDCVGLETMSFEADPDDLLRRVKGKNNLSRQQLAVLRQLASWREQQAIGKNLPRRWLIADEILILMTEHLPDNLEQLRDIDEISEKVVSKYGQQCLEQISLAKQIPDTQWPKANTRPTPEEKALFKSLQKRVSSAAKNSGLQPGLLASRKTIQGLIDGHANNKLLHGWRQEIVGDQLVELLASE